jgi:hypothetical protein
LDDNTLAEIIPYADDDSLISRVSRVRELSGVFEKMNRNYLLEHSRVTLLEWVTDDDRAIRAKAEQFLYQMFKELGPFVKYQNVEDIIERKEYKHAEMESYSTVCPQALIDEARELLDAAVRFLEAELEALGERTTNLIRVVHWMRCRLTLNRLGPFGRLLIRAIHRRMHPDLPLLELLRLLEDTVIFTDVSSLRSEDCWECLVPDQVDSGFRCIFLVDALHAPSALFESKQFSAVTRSLFVNNDTFAIRYLLDRSRANFAKACWRHSDVLLSSPAFTLLRNCLEDIDVNSVVESFFCCPHLSNVATVVLGLVSRDHFAYTDTLKARLLSVVGFFVRMKGADFLVLQRAAADSEAFAIDLVSLVLTEMDQHGLTDSESIACLLRLCKLCQKLTDVDIRSQRVAEIGNRVLLFLDNHLIEPVIEQLTGILRADPFEKAEFWSMILFSELCEVNARLASLGGQNFCKLYLQKVEQETVDALFLDRKRLLDHPEDAAEFEKGVRILGLIFDGHPTLRMRFLQEHPLDSAVFRAWPDRLAKLKSVFVPSG